MSPISHHSSLIERMNFFLSPDHNAHVITWATHERNRRAILTAEAFRKIFAEHGVSEGLSLLRDMPRAWEKGTPK